jgi:telomere length regulation protein
MENAAEPDSDDESLQGYASEENSDRAPSPTPSELEEIEKDPTLNVGVKKIPKPVYLAQLGELVRSTSAGLKSAENDEPDKIEMALNCGEDLIRRKRNFGMELGRRPMHLQGQCPTDTACCRGDRREPSPCIHRTTEFVRVG